MRLKFSLWSKSYEYWEKLSNSDNKSFLSESIWHTEKEQTSLRQILPVFLCVLYLMPVPDIPEKNQNRRQNMHYYSQTRVIPFYVFDPEGNLMGETLLIFDGELVLESFKELAYLGFRFILWVDLGIFLCMGERWKWLTRWLNLRLM